MTPYHYRRGITLVETLVVLGVLSIIAVGIVTLFKDTFSLNRFISEELSVSGEARRAIKLMTAEIRTASPSSNGAYPIVQTATSSFTFYSNIDTDSYKERVRYFASGTTLFRGITKPTGSPMIYNTANESRTELVHGLVQSTTTPFFMYYDTNYMGTTSLPTSTPALLDVRHVRIYLPINSSQTDLSTTSVFATQITLRNLKDNL